MASRALASWLLAAALSAYAVLAAAQVELPGEVCPEVLAPSMLQRGADRSPAVLLEGSAAGASADAEWEDAHAGREHPRSPQNASQRHPRRPTWRNAGRGHGNFNIVAEDTSRVDVPGASATGVGCWMHTTTLTIRHAASTLLTYGSMRLEELASRLFGPSAMRVEMHLKATVKSLHSGPLGPLHVFVKKLRAAICEALDVPLRRIQPLSVRGAWLTLSLGELDDEDADWVSKQPFDADSTEQTSDVPGSEDLTSEDLTEQAIVDFEVLASPQETDPTPTQLARTWRSQLSNMGSPLRSGPSLGDVLAGATLRVPGDTHHVLDSGSRHAGGLGNVLIGGAALLALLQLSGP